MSHTISYPRPTGWTRTIQGLAILLIGSGMAACNLIEYHPYEVRVPDDERNLNAKAIERIKAATTGKDTLTIIHMGDTQRFYDELDGFVSSANKHKADFVLLAGDITDFGVNDEYSWVHDKMKKLNKPYIAVIGNHDLSGNGELVFEKRYGPLDDSFILNDFKFIMLNTNSREYEFRGHIPNLNWLRNELNDDQVNHIIVMSHVPPFDGDFDPNLEEGYRTALVESGKVKLSLHGHQHTYRNSEYYNDGIRYVVSTSMDERMYLIIKVCGDKYNVEEVYF